MRDVLKAIMATLEAGERAALATVVSVRGSTPQVQAARLLLRADGSSVGTVGGGAIERHVQEALFAILNGGGASLLRCDLGRDLGMSCGGSMEIFVEPIMPLPRLVICGAGHVAHATAPLARAVGFEVVIVDERAEQNHAARFPACRLLLCSPREASLTLATHADEWVLFLSHSHAVDLDALLAFAERPHRYLGLMGSRRKVLRMLRGAQERGARIRGERLYAPVGLHLGAVTPAEIAVSIVAELVAVRHEKTPRHLRALDDPTVARFLAAAPTDPRVAKHVPKCQGC